MDQTILGSASHAIKSFHLEHQQIKTMVMVNSSPTTVQYSYDAKNINSTFLALKSFANFLLFHQFNNFSPEQKNEPKNVANCNYHDIDQFQNFLKNVSDYPYVEHLLKPLIRFLL